VKIADFWNSPEVVLPEKHGPLEEWLRGRAEFEGHVIFRTSGSSGVEKWVALSQEAMEWSARRVIDHLGIDSSDVCGLALPMIHVGGFGLALRAHLTKARLAVFPGKWHAGDFGEWCEREGVSLTSLVPTQVRDLVDAKVKSPSCLRSVVVGGGRLEDRLAALARELGWPVEPSYGMTETSAQVATGDGLPLFPGWEARLEGDCLALKGGGLLTSVITGGDGEFVARDPKVDGWLVTQDRVRLEGRRLTVLGRADRRVKVLGELVDLEELEAFWRERLKCEVALLGGEHDRRGTGLVLFLEGCDQRVEELNQELPGPERLVAWKVLPELPRSALGKIDRRKLTGSLAELRCFEAADQEG